MKKQKSEAADVVQELFKAASINDQITNEELRRRLKAADAKLRKYAGNRAVILDAVSSVFEGVPPLIPVPPAKVAHKKTRGLPEEIAVLQISDVQLGKSTISYNTQVAIERLSLLAEKTVAIAEARSSYAKIKECRVYLCGDIVEGEDIFAGQAHHIDSSVLEQAIVEAPRALAGVVAHLLTFFEKVRVVCVHGNHGRVGRKGESHPKTNWDIACYEVLRLLLTSNESMKKRVTIDVAEDWYIWDAIYEWGNLLIHGDKGIKGFAGFPWYGVGRKAQGWADVLSEPWDYLWFGHFHTYTSSTLNFRYWMCNGTTESDNDYAKSELAASGHPCQRLAFFNKEVGLISENCIFLDTGRRKPQRNKYLDYTSK